MVHGIRNGFIAGVRHIGGLEIALGGNGPICAIRYYGVAPPIIYGPYAVVVIIRYCIPDLYIKCSTLKNYRGMPEIIFKNLRTYHESFQVDKWPLMLFIVIMDSLRQLRNVMSYKKT